MSTIFTARSGGYWDCDYRDRIRLCRGIGNGQIAIPRRGIAYGTRTRYCESSYGNLTSAAAFTASFGCGDGYLQHYRRR